MLPQHRVIIAVTGASGSCYAEELLVRLLSAGVRTYLLFTENAIKVTETELHESLLATLAKSTQTRRFEEDEALKPYAQLYGLSPDNFSQLKIYRNNDLYAPVASGSEGATHMVVCPASMGSCARIAHGISSNLIERAADVLLKEKRPLIVVPRETPFSLIHLQNLTALAQAGAHIIPAMPAFYHRPREISDLVNFLVERILESLKLEGVSLEKKVRWNFRQL